jgi:hypothetical protein
MTDDPMLRVLEEIRDLQRQHVENYREAIRDQQDRSGRVLDGRMGPPILARITPTGPGSSVVEWPPHPRMQPTSARWPAARAGRSGEGGGTTDRAGVRLEACS